MKTVVYPLGVSLALCLLASSCIDHREQPSVQSCRIVRESVKFSLSSSSSTPVEETVAVDASAYGLSTAQPFNFGSANQIRTYSYNNQGQVLQQNTAINANSTPTEVINYQYTGSTLRAQTTGTSPGVIDYLLNGQGLITSTADGRNTYTYNADGYLIEKTEFISSVGSTQKTTYTIENGNIVKLNTTGPGFTLTTVFTYDLSKPNLPTIRLYEGRQSRNLLIKSVQDYADTNLGSPGRPFRSNFTTTYAYTYDAQGRVSRRVGLTAYSSASNGAEPPLANAAGLTVNVVDYTYSCQ